MNKLQRLKIWWYRLTGQPSKKMGVYSNAMHGWIKEGIQEQQKLEKGKTNG